MAMRWARDAFGRTREATGKFSCPACASTDSIDGTAATRDGATGSADGPAVPLPAISAIGRSATPSLTEVIVPKFRGITSDEISRYLTDGPRENSWSGS